LVKTFWGWGEQQLPAATLILTAPSGRTYGTAPGSVLLLPGLCAPAGAITTPAPDPAPERCGDRTATLIHTPPHPRAPTHRHRTQPQPPGPVGRANRTNRHGATWRRSTALPAARVRSPGLLDLSLFLPSVNQRL